MSVYVGTIRYPYRNMIMFHMASPNLDELHAMADKIGINRKWFQNKDKGKKKGDTLTPHYDICLSKKKLALQHGAIEVNDRELVKICFPKLMEILKINTDGK